VVPERIAAIVKGIAEACVEAGCALIGGETAEHPGLLDPDEYDVAGATTGVVEAEKLLGPGRALAAETQTHAMSHVTGGGLAANLARVMPEELAATIERGTWTPAPVFDLVRRVGDVPQPDLEQTLNCGVGMVALTDAEDADRAIAVLDRFGIRAWVAGSVGAGDGGVELVGQHPGW
jgi:phosphoribosylformylglycinamidine cyclo-ligase